jgi:predicted dehydrogenase
MLKIGVIGVGHLGRIHIKCINEIPDLKLMGFFDIDQNRAGEVSKALGIRNYSAVDELINECDIVDIVTPTSSHFKYAAKALKHSRHVFIEKPVATTPEEALKLIDISNETNVKIQVGHVERYNPAFVAALPFIHNPKSIIMHRLTNFTNRGTDIPVILDLMIHDIDLVLFTVQANLVKISAKGIAVRTNTADIVKALLEFDNGCVADLTASRIATTPERKAIFMQQNANITVDFLNIRTEVDHIHIPNHEMVENTQTTCNSVNGNYSRQLFSERPEIRPANAITSELTSFTNSIVKDTTPEVTLIDGYKALKVAYQILDKIEWSLAI